MPEPTPAACTPACSEQHTYVPPCELAPAPASADLRAQIAEAIRNHKATLNLGGAVQFMGPVEDLADAVLRVPAIADALGAMAAAADIDRGYCPHCGRGDCSPTAAQWLRERQRAVRSWLPALRRAIDCLDTTCRYHGNRLDPDRFGRMTRSEACCDTGIEPRRAREARAALEALAALDRQEQQ